MLGERRMAAAGLAAAAACWLGALGASAAQAEEEPQFFTKAAVGQVAPEVKETFSLGIFHLEGHTSKANIECAGGSGSGVVDGAKSMKEVRLNFAGCEIKSLIQPNCPESKKIETNNLVGELGLVTSTKDGLRLKPESGTYVTEFPCFGGAIVIKVKGSVIAEITGAESAGKTVAESKFRASGDVRFAKSGGIQKYTEFLGESSGQQLEAVVREGGKEHEELEAWSGTVVVKSIPAADIGETT